MNVADWINLGLLLSILRLSVPLILASLGGIISERSGVVQIALEGFMLVGAFSGAALTHYLQNPFLGFAIASFIGGIFGLIFALFANKFQTEQIVLGTAFNLLIAGMIPFLSKYLFDSTGSTPSLPIEQRFAYEPLILTVIAVTFIHYLLNHMRLGFWIQFSGEKPECLESAGINTKQVRYFSLFTCGLLAAMGGASLSLYLASSYSPMMTAGRGFIALSAVILGKWRPIPTALACLLFGFLDALQIRLQGLKFGDFAIPVQWIQVLPYVITILILAGIFGQSRAPQGLGKKI